MASDQAKDADQNAGVDPDESPFAVPGVEGIPYKKGSDEDRAVRRVIEEAERQRENASAAAD